MFRYAIYKSKAEKINRHNEHCFKNGTGNHTHFLAINQFSSLTNDEFRAKYLSIIPEFNRTKE